MAKPVKSRSNKPDNVKQYKKREKDYFDISWSSLGSTVPKQLWKMKSKPINTSSITEIKSAKHWETQQAKQQLHPLSDDTNFTQITLTAIIHLSFFLQMKKSTKNPELVSVSKRHDRCTGEHEHHAKSLHSNLIWWLKIKIKNHSSVLRLVWAETWLPPDTHHRLLYIHHVVWPW